MATNKSNMSFNAGDFKNLKDQLKQACDNAKKEEEEKIEKGEEVAKQTLGNKLLGFVILIALVVIVGVVFISNIGLIFMPKNSVTIKVTDQNGDLIDGLNLYVSGTSVFEMKFDENSGSEITEVAVQPGNYHVSFTKIPKGYTCSDVNDKFTLAEDGKVKLEYVCKKD